MIDKAHANGIKVYGATILPFGKSFYEKPFRIEAWKKVNDWIRNSGSLMPSLILPNTCRVKIRKLS
ncbi:hypothetical protein EJ377_01310 [Chryseobacterium arthrosphaerae]|uniref:Uncharacterized protein n=1 Tax=Chryseobacterium arthrosphaerae TaxID=651561 RepID=A0A432DYJ1_9FLAO|nr:hypothetical protein EJ377_01310 [Chryseobacterium arthrosphaerae]